MERAAEWILNHPEESMAMELDVGACTQDTQAEVKYPDGSGSTLFGTLSELMMHLSTNNV